MRALLAFCVFWGHPVVQWFGVSSWKTHFVRSNVPRTFVAKPLWTRSYITSSIITKTLLVVPVKRYTLILSSILLPHRRPVVVDGIGADCPYIDLLSESEQLFHHYEFIATYRHGVLLPPRTWCRYII